MAAIMGRPTAEVSEAETEDVTAVDQGASVEAEPEGESPATVEAALVEESEETPVVEEVEAWGWTAIGVDEGVAAVDDGVPLGTEAQRDVKAAAPEAPGVEGPEPVAADEVKSLAGESVPVKAEISGEAEVTAPEAEAAGGEPGTVPVETLAAAEATGPAIERAAPIEVEASEAVEATAAEIEASEEYAAAPLQAVSLVSETVPAIEEDEPVEAKAPEEVEAAAPEAEAPEEPEAEPVETLAMAEAASIEAEVSEEGEAAAPEAGAPEEPEAVLLEAPAVAETTTLAIEEAASVEVGAPEEVEVVTAITSEGEEPVVGPADAPLEAMPLEPEEEVVEVEQLEPAELEVPVRAAEALAAAMTDAPEPPAAAIESLRRAVDRDRRDYPSWLELGRRLWDAGDQPQSMRAYSRLIRAGKLLDIVIPDLEQRVAERPGVEVQQMLGDAYMKDGRLKEALQTYRRALNDL